MSLLQDHLREQPGMLQKKQSNVKSTLNNDAHIYLFKSESS